MIRHLIRAAALSSVLGLFALPAQALPLSTAARVGDAPPVTLVAGGCGFGFHRGPFGGCRRNWGPRRFYGPRCFYRPTPYGPRRFCR